MPWLGQANKKWSGCVSRVLFPRTYFDDVVSSRIEDAVVCRVVHSGFGHMVKIGAGRRSFIWTDGYPPARLSAATYPSLMARRADTGLYLVLQGVGFAVPAMSPSPRCALTAPFHPCLYAAPTLTMCLRPLTNDSTYNGSCG